MTHEREEERKLGGGPGYKRAGEDDPGRRRGRDRDTPTKKKLTGPEGQLHTEILLFSTLTCTLFSTSIRLSTVLFTSSRVLDQVREAKMVVGVGPLEGRTRDFGSTSYKFNLQWGKQDPCGRT